MKRIYPSPNAWRALAVFVCTLLVCRGQQPTDITYEGLPKRFGIPATPADLVRWLGFDPFDNQSDLIPTMDIRALRRHAWNIFAGMTSPSHSRRAGVVLPIWETWFRQDEVFRPPQTSTRKPVSRFEYPPEQLTPHDGEQRVITVASRVLFNREARDHIQGECLYLQSKLQCLYDQAAGTGANGTKMPREIPDFPREATTVKTTWIHVSSDKCTSIPVWNDEPTDPDTTANPTDQWKRKISVYAPQVSPASCRDKDRVPLGAFYQYQILDDDDVQAWNDMAQPNVKPDPTIGPMKKGDYVVLAGLHFAIREIPNWVWATFWWHDRPNEGVFAADRPAAVRDVWRHYLMDVAYDMDRPREHDTSPKITFNPYLEGFLTDGVQSNCMTCHRRALWPKGHSVLTQSGLGDPLSEAQIVVRGSEAAKATYLPDFEDRLKLHFVWSLAAHSVKPDGQTTLPASCGCSTHP